MPVTIRTATLSDLKTVQDLNYQLFLSDKKNDPELVIDWPYSQVGEGYFKGVIEGDDSICFIAEEAGMPVGYLAGTVRQKTSYRTRRMSEVENMFVSLDQRSSGLGSRLLEAFFSWSIEMGANSCVVDAYTPNVRAIEFYRKNGLETTAPC